MWTYLEGVEGVAIILTAIFNTSMASACCDTLGYSPAKRYLSVSGSEKYISLYWGSDPSHAATALFKVVLNCAHGYQNINMKHGPHSLKDLAKSVPFNESGLYKDAILGLSTGWERDLEPIRRPLPGATSGLGAPRLEVITASKIPARLRLHVYSPTKFQSIKECRKLTHWSFYTKAEALKSCGFTNSSRDVYAMVYTIQDSSKRTTRIAKKLNLRANATLMHLHFKELDRKSFFKKLLATNESFLFIDYEMWTNTSHINSVQEPPCLLEEGPACLPEIDTAIDMRVTDMFMLAEYASQLFHLAYIFDPPLEALIFILQEHASKKNIEEAACEWVTKNNHTVYERWVKDYEAKKKLYEIAVFYSAHGTDKNKYTKFLDVLRAEVSKQIKSNLHIKLYPYLTDTYNTNNIKRKINDYLVHGNRQQLIGAVAGGDNKIITNAPVFDKIGIPVLLYDVTAIDVDTTESVYLTTGRPVHLALAMNYFIVENNWTRIAVLSDTTNIAEQFLKDLNNCTADRRDAKKLALRDHRLDQVTSLDVEKVLKELRNENAYIIIVNTHSPAAAIIIKTAVELQMNNDKGYVWIIREWVECNEISNLKYFTMSFSCPSINEISSNNTRQQLFNEMDELWPRRTWPWSAATLADAVLTLAKGFENVVNVYPQAREDTHSIQAIRQFGLSLNNLSTIKGFTQNLVYEQNSLEETVVYLDEWQHGHRTLLARWRVNATAKTVNIDHVYQETYFKNFPPRDGTSGCLLSSGDKYLPTCYDSLWGFAIFFLSITPLAVILVYRIIQNHLQKIQMRVLHELQSQRRQRTASLSNYLVDRKALKPRRELGAGQFGRVMLVDLHKLDSRTQVVAAKELRDHRNESEILHEASILASLKHDNIIRLVGVCIDDKPTLVLMEVAFFGDLLHYLQDRRYLAESVPSDLNETIHKGYEQTHVSAKELTRLAREAASALAYLALRGVIHRDVRASNCLVDTKRSLKLADFGLARETKCIGLDGDEEYACQRRGLLPVLWMAPESLIYAVFSAASDMYSFGVLLFEIVTLGARPYGAISPLRVMHFVTSGGKPSMPRDATPQSRALAQLCWQLESKNRPTAADVVAYLAENPHTLRPAFKYDDDESTDVQSGDDESSFSEILLT